VEDFKGKVAVVTGAASGIGLAMATRFAADGMAVVMADVEEPALEEAAADLLATGAEVLAVPCDVASLESVHELRDVALERHGRVHVLCNNAGVSGGGMISDLSVGEWRWVLGVNLFGVIHGIDAFLCSMIDHGEPAHVINTASMAGHLPGPGMGTYSVSKFGVVALSETLLAEMRMAGTNVGVSVLCPGWVDTRIAESDRNRPADIKRSSLDAPGAQAMEDFVKGLLAGGSAPSEIAEAVVTAISQDAFWVLPHHDFDDNMRARFDSILARTTPPGLFG